MKKNNTYLIPLLLLLLLLLSKEPFAQFSFVDIYKLNKAKTHGFREEAKKNKIQNLRIEIYKNKSRNKEKLIGYEERYFNEKGLLVHYMEVSYNSLMRSNTYIYNDTTIKFMINSQGLHKIFNYQYSFDTLGKLNNINVKLNGYLYDNIDYIYDDNDKLIAVIGGQKYKHQYDNKTTFITQGNDTIFEITYDNENRVINYKEYDWKGVSYFEYKADYTPDSLTLLTYNRLGEKISEDKEYYNKNGNLIKVIYTYNKDYKREEYKYDDNGLITQIKVYNKKGKCIRIKKYIYTYYM